MFRLSRLLLLHGLVAAGLAVVLAHAAEPIELEPLFNGMDLTGWNPPIPNPFWRVEHGVLVGENDPALAGSMLWSKNEFRDFVLECDVRWQGDIDSGVIFRRPALQVQIGTSVSLKRDMTGSFYVNKVGYPEAAQAKEAAKWLKFGDWNALRIEARGATFTVSINGHRVSQFTDSSYAGPGPIGLQIHPKVKMKVEFRNMRIAAVR
jgi:hypothetical protein